MSTRPNSFKFITIEEFKTLALRILVIDDKVGDGSGCACQDKKTRDLFSNTKFAIEDCSKLKNSSPNCKKCKLHTIKKLMEYNNPGHQYWNQDSITTFYCCTIFPDFINDTSLIPSKELLVECEFAPQIKYEKPHVQIIGVRDVRTALFLMSKYKFDMIFCDYLLDYKKGTSGPRDYSTQLFKFIAHKQISDEEKKELSGLKSKHTPTPKETIKLELLSKYESLEHLRHDVLDNRGPLDKLWIMPITCFNQTFIQDLYRTQINLIDYKWNISNGADSITTPWQFLFHLNKFIELQLNSCIYTTKKLMTFLQYSGENLKESLNPTELMAMVSCFEEFQQFMGAEYSKFMKRYGARKLIERDAAKSDDNNENKSVFATYISKNFYNNPNYSTEIELNRLMQDFYHQAATMFDDREGRKCLREAFEQMRLIITYNQLEEELDDDGKTKLKEGLLFFNTVIDSEFDAKKIKEWCDKRQSGK